MSKKTKTFFFITLAVMICTAALLTAYEYWDFGNYILYDTTKMAMYNFNEGSGMYTHEDSGRNKTGTIYGDRNWVDEKDSNLFQDAALEFDGYDDYVRVAHNTDFNISNADNIRGFVISAMIKIPDNCDREYLMICSKYKRIPDPYHPNDPDYDYSYGFTFYLTDGQLRFSGYNGQVDQDPSKGVNVQDSDGDDLRDGDWHFAAVEYHDDEYRLIIDPTETYDGVVETKNSSLLPGNTDTDYFIGRRDIYWDYDKDFIGIMDFVYFYEIDAEWWDEDGDGTKENIVNAPHCMWGNTNVGLWTFDEGNGTPGNIVNDFVRWTSPDTPNTPGGYHSYGIANGDGIYFLGRANAWKGEHALEFNNAGAPHAFVNVPDPNNYLDFAAPVGEDDIYIEMHIMPNNIFTGINPLVAKWDDLPVRNGYRVYLVGGPGNTANVVFEVARNGSSNSTISPLINFWGDWYHVVAWVQDRWLHLFVKNETTQIWREYTVCCSPGIGATSSQLYFAAQEVNGVMDPMNGILYDGWMDEVVIGHLFPE